MISCQLVPFRMNRLIYAYPLYVYNVCAGLFKPWPPSRRLIRYLTDVKWGGLSAWLFEPSPLLGYMQVPQPESDSLLLREVPIWEQSRGNSASLPPVTRNTAWPLLVKTLHIELEGLNRPNDLSQAMLI